MAEDEGGRLRHDVKRQGADPDLVVAYSVGADGIRATTWQPGSRPAALLRRSEWKTLPASGPTRAGSLPILQSLRWQGTITWD